MQPQDDYYVYTAITTTSYGMLHHVLSVTGGPYRSKAVTAVLHHAQGDHRSEPGIKCVGVHAILSSCSYNTQKYLLTRSAL